ncbi:hypothetical protein Fmac_010885 [Flemingia macrophylla]|uniref:Legume lectin domain-containing protein n=1 Tax=Flemingia macrophylla TaxID=520843 RepID=A0ABD1MKZ7_9FABA
MELGDNLLPDMQIPPQSEVVRATTNAGGGRFIAVEFDTLMDVEFNDINGNHIGVDLNNVVSSEAGDLTSIGIDLKGGDLINAWIEFDRSSKGLSVWVSYSNLKLKDLVLLMNLDLDKYLNDFMYVGFSGSTQGSTEINRIEWWSFGMSSEAATLRATYCLIHDVSLIYGHQALAILPSGFYKLGDGYAVGIWVIFQSRREAQDLISSSPAVTSSVSMLDSSNIVLYDNNHTIACKSKSDHSSGRYALTAVAYSMISTISVSMLQAIKLIHIFSMGM